MKNYLTIEKSAKNLRKFHWNTFSSENKSKCCEIFTILFIKARCKYLRFIYVTAPYESNRSKSLQKAWPCLFYELKIMVHLSVLIAFSESFPFFMPQNIVVFEVQRRFFFFSQIPWHISLTEAISTGIKTKFINMLITHQ